MKSTRQGTAPQLVVFPCTDDVGRAQVAVAWFRLLADPVKARAVLATDLAAPRILADLPAVLKEKGLLLTSIHARQMTDDLIAAADRVVTMGGTFSRRLLGGAPPRRREHWLIPSAGAAGDRDLARDLCELIRSRVAMLVFSEGWGRANSSRESARVTRSHRANDFHAAF